MKPLIGLTTYGRNEENHFHLPSEYVDSVRRAGGIPFLIPHGIEDTTLVLARCDGVILSGGGDLHPNVYGGEQHESIYMTDEERDTGELELARQLADGEIPTLAICRGMQVLNVALGGTLIEHLPDEVGKQVEHRKPPREPTPHAVKLLPDSFLAQVMQCDACVAQSWHHQAIRKVAGPLCVVAHAPDGVIEAVEMPGHAWLLAVQWHPELSAANDPAQQRLFDQLVQASSRQEK